MNFKRVVKRVITITVWATMLLCQGCSNESTPEIIATEFIHRVESTIENHSLIGLRDLISKNYQDEHGRRQPDMLSLAAAYLMRTKSIHLFIDLQSASFLSERTINCRLLAAFTTTPIESRSVLPEIDGDVYWFDIDLIEEDDEWRLTNADWQQAMLEDILAGGDSAQP